MINDSAVEVADVFARSFARAVENKLDNACFLGDGSSTYGGIIGIKSALSNASSISAFQAAATGAWSSIVEADILKLCGSVASWTSQYEKCFVCSVPFAHQVLAKILFNKGGTTANDLANGIPQQLKFLGYPVYTTSVMPTTTAATSVCLLFGAMSASCKLGEVSGSYQVASSTERYFDQDAIGMRCVTRNGFVAHEPGDASTLGGFASLST